jgi:NADH-quinone oxidoreductase subunit C
MSDVLSSFQDRFPGVKPRPSLDLPAFDISADDLLAICRHLRDELKFDLLLDVTAVDWKDRSPRFSTVYHLFSTTHHNYVRLVVDCPDDENPKVPSLVSLFPTANWHERETFDMFGIRFAEHPDLRRILMWDEYPFFPLRKEFPLAGIETELADAEIGRNTGANLTKAPMSGGPFVAKPRDHSSKREPRAKDESWTERNPKPI